MSLTLEEMVRAVAGGLSDVSKKPNVYAYQPNEGAQAEFHKSTSVGRLLVGDNRSGKTAGGIVEGCWRAIGKHPYQKVPDGPTHGRIITVDFDYGADQIIVPALQQWMPPSMLIRGSWEDSYHKSKHLLKLANGSTIEIKAHGQKLDSFAGTPRHWLHVDEECPKSIFIESKARLLDYNGCYWITMTPVEGITWVYDEMVEGVTKGVKVFYIDVRNNKRISQEAIETLRADLNEEEQQIRLGGGEKNFIPRGGRVLSEFNYDRHVIEPGMPPRYWTIYISIDSGFNNPTAVHWHALSTQGQVLTFFEHYRRKWTVRRHAERILEVNEELKVTPYLYIIDPSTAQNNEQTGHSVLMEYRLNGIPAVQGRKHNDNTYIDRMNDYLKRDQWKITKSCPNLIREARKLPWKTHRSPKIADRSNRIDKALEKDDHAIDSVGYFFTFVPELRGIAEEDTPPVRDEEIKEMFPEPVSKTQTNPDNFPWRIDRNLARNRNRTPNHDLCFGEIP